MERNKQHMDIKRLVAENDLDRASQLLWELDEKLGGERTKEIVILKRGLNEVNHLYRLGGLNFKDFSEMKNQLASRFLDILENMPMSTDFC